VSDADDVTADGGQGSTPSEPTGSEGVVAPTTGASGNGAAGAPGRDVELRNVSHTYGRGRRALEALAPLDLTIDHGQFVCIVGPSGCGKTTLMQMVAGFLEPTTGEVLVGGEQVHGPSPDRGVVFQQPNLYPWLSVQGNVEFGPRMRGIRKAERRTIAQDQLELVGLGDVGELKPYELSGGMQQRCQIARVLANDPQVLLMDEPFGALDAITRERLQLELLRIRAATDKTVLFITHGVEEAAFLADRVVVLSPRPGRVVFDELGPFAGQRARAEDARSDPEFVKFRDRVRAHIT